MQGLRIRLISTPPSDPFPAAPPPHIPSAESQLPPGWIEESPGKSEEPFRAFSIELLSQPLPGGRVPLFYEQVTVVKFVLP